MQAVQENYAETPHVEAQVAMMIANQAADNDNQVSIQQVRQQLEEEYPLAAVPFDDYVEKSDVIDSAAQPVTVTLPASAGWKAAACAPPTALR